MAKRRSPEETEDIILRKIYLVTLTDPMETQSVYLEMTAAQIISEGRDLRLSRDSLEQIVIDRLTLDSEEVEPPFHYLVNCYRQACEEERKIANMKDQNVRSRMESAVRQAKKLAVSYSRIHLGNPGMFPDRDAGKPSPLLPLVLSEVSTPVDGCDAGIKSPPGFIQELFSEGDYDSMKHIYKQVYEGLRDSVIKVSVLGNFQQPLRALQMLINFPVGAKVLADLHSGLGLNGRGLETSTILGAFFHVSALPDPALNSLPDVGQVLFSVASSVDVVSPSNTIRSLMNSLQNGLKDIIKCLLKNGTTRESILQFLADLINKNASRARIQPDPWSCASSGTFVNLSAVLLQLCEPFLLNPKKWDMIDPRYAYSSRRLELRELTSINATSEQVSELARAAAGSNNQPSFSFICECFFMTARVLNLGLVRTVSYANDLYKTIKENQDTLSSLRENLQNHSTSPELGQEVANLEKSIERMTQECSCYDAQIVTNRELIQRALYFYRMAVDWMINLVGGFKMPLPTCPMHFAAIPEHFVDDAMDLLIHVSRMPPKLGMLDNFPLEDFLNFIIMFMGSPEFIRNPYLRAKMVEVLNNWMPRYSSSPSTTNKLFEGHQPAVDYLVRNLLQIYVDIEFTGSHNQFFDKFSIRYNISKLLKYLWEVPSHKNAWIRIARDEERGLYLKFLNFLLNDSIYLLDESLKKIIKSKESDSRETSFIRMEMTLANVDVNMLCFSSEEIVAPFLLPEMVERVASMLNYFLSQLVGPQRRSLFVTDPEKYKFRPKELVEQIVKIYVNLASKDAGNVFAVAITKDGRSYNDKLFDDAADVLRRIGEDPRLIRDFSELGRKVRIASEEARESESARGEVPEEFLDPLMNEVMMDPVILPVSKVTIDRSVILRHLLSKSTDPFTADVHLTADMLVPNTELKAKIDNFLRS